MENKNNIFIYLLVVFFAMFVGTGIFFASNSTTIPKKPKKEVVITTSIITPIIQTQGSLNLKLADGVVVTKDKEMQIDLFADSNEKNISGYDLALSYDPLAFDFIKATSSLVDFKIYSYKKNNYLSILGAKTLQSKTQSVFAKTKIVSLIFKPTKKGEFNFVLKPIINKDKTDLVTEKTEILNPQLNELRIKVN